jgi:hypothetical protein
LTSTAHSSSTSLPIMNRICLDKILNTSTCEPIVSSPSINGNCE